VTRFILSASLAPADSTKTLPVLAKTTLTSPIFPLSLPEITTTLSPFLRVQYLVLIYSLFSSL